MDKGSKQAFGKGTLFQFFQKKETQIDKSVLKETQDDGEAHNDSPAHATVKGACRASLQSEVPERAEQKTAMGGDIENHRSNKDSAKGEIVQNPGKKKNSITEKTKNEADSGSTRKSPSCESALHRNTDSDNLVANKQNAVAKNPFQILMTSSKKKGIWDKPLKTKDTSADSSEESSCEEIQVKDPASVTTKFFPIFSLKKTSNIQLSAVEKKEGETCCDKQNESRKHQQDSTDSHEEASTTKIKPAKRKKLSPEMSEDLVEPTKKRPKKGKPSNKRSQETESWADVQETTNHGAKRLRIVSDSSDFEPAVVSDIEQNGLLGSKPGNGRKRERRKISLLESKPAAKTVKAAVLKAQKLVRKSRHMKTKSVEKHAINEPKGEDDGSERSQVHASSTKRVNGKPVKTPPNSHHPTKVVRRRESVSGSTLHGDEGTPRRRSSRVSNPPERFSLAGSDLDFTPGKTKPERSARRESLENARKDHAHTPKCKKSARKLCLAHNEKSPKRKILAKNRPKPAVNGVRKTKAGAGEDNEKSPVRRSGRVKCRRASVVVDTEESSDIADVTPAKTQMARRRRRRQKSAASDSSSSDIVVVKEKSAKSCRQRVDAFALMRRAGQPPPPLPQESPGKAAARRAFLESGVPEQLIVQAEVARELEQSLTPLFPELSHVTQRDACDALVATSVTPGQPVCPDLQRLRWRAEPAPLATPPRRVNRLVVMKGSVHGDERSEIVKVGDDTIESVRTSSGVQQELSDAGNSAVAESDSGDSRAPDAPITKCRAWVRADASAATKLSFHLDLKSALPHLRRLAAARTSAPSPPTSSSPPATTGTDSSAVLTASVSPWTELFRPAAPEAFVPASAARAAEELLLWLQDWRAPSAPWDEYSDEVLCDSAVLLLGPSGCGKTSAVYAAAAKLGLQVLEVSASCRRSGRHLSTRLAEATQSHKMTLPGGAGVAASEAADPSHSLLLLEDIQLVSDELDDGFLAAAASLAAAAKRPVVLTADDATVTRTRLLRALPHRLIEFLAPRRGELARYLQMVGLAQGCVVRDEEAEAVAVEAGGDVRRGLLQLQWLCESAECAEKVDARSTLAGISGKSKRLTSECSGGNTGGSACQQNAGESSPVKSAYLEDSGDEADATEEQPISSSELFEEALSLLPCSLRLLPALAADSPSPPEPALPRCRTLQLRRRPTGWRRPVTSQKPVTSYDGKRQKRWRVVDTDLFSDDDDATAFADGIERVKFPVVTDDGSIKPAVKLPPETETLLFDSVSALAELSDQRSAADAFMLPSEAASDGIPTNDLAAQSWWYRAPVPDMSELECPLLVDTEKACSLAEAAVRSIQRAAVTSCSGRLDAAMSRFRQSGAEGSVRYPEEMVLLRYCEEDAIRTETWSDSSRMALAVPSLLLGRAALTADVLPSVRRICRLECVRRSQDGGRTRRFLHYLDQMGLHAVPSDLRERICESLM